MTDREKAIVMAYTGTAMLCGEKFAVFRKYIEEICGGPIYTHELADKKILDVIAEKSREDFIKLCESESRESVDEAYLYDWYIHSVSEDDPPVWTKEHIKELVKDFDLYIKHGEKK